MKTLLCFLWLIIFPTLFAESIKSERRVIKQAIHLLHALGPKQCHSDVVKTHFDLFSSLPKKEQGNKVLPALKILFKSTFELFKKNTHGHWNSAALFNLRELLNRQTKSYEKSTPVVSSELEELVKNFKQLDQFLTQENFRRCAWEIVRNEILGAMDHFKKMTIYRQTYLIL